MRLGMRNVPFGLLSEISTRRGFKEMKKIVWSLICATALVLANSTPAMAESLSFGQVIDGLSAKNKTKAELREVWGKFKRQEINWSGTVHDVDKSRDEAKVYIADKSRPLYEGFNIYIVTKDVDKAMKLKRGDAVHFKGLIDDYHVHDGVTVVKIGHAELQ